MEQCILFPFGTIKEILQKDERTAFILVEAICKYRFSGVKPQHLTKEQNEYFQKVLPKCVLTTI